MAACNSVCKALQLRSGSGTAASAPFASCAKHTAPLEVSLASPQSEKGEKLKDSCKPDVLVMDSTRRWAAQGTREEHSAFACGVFVWGSEEERFARSVSRDTVACRTLCGKSHC